jgi:hypothetical protein
MGRAEGGLDPADSLKFRSYELPSRDVFQIDELSNQVEETYSGRLGALVVDLRVCTAVSCRKGRNYLISHK